jgi:hypothetical protein
MCALQRLRLSLLLHGVFGALPRPSGIADHPVDIQSSLDLINSEGTDPFGICVHLSRSLKRRAATGRTSTHIISRLKEIDSLYFILLLF